MKLGFDIKILGTDYHLDFEDKLKDQGILGYCNFQAYTLRIDKSLVKHPKQLKRILWHEIFHAYAEESGLNDLIGPQAAEQFCQTASALVVQLTNGRLKDQG